MDGVNPTCGAPVPSILLIDDDNRLASMVADYLRDHQFEVSHAATGAAALAVIKRQSFDLILLDLMLPDTDGLTLFRELSTSRVTPVIMLTARGLNAFRLSPFWASRHRPEQPHRAAWR